ncbi:unnamed protein product, partial [Vitis vinifera]
MRIECFMIWPPQGFGLLRHVNE